jgi:hypothetical protein
MAGSRSSFVRLSVMGGLLLGLASAAPAFASSPRTDEAVLGPSAWSAPQRAVKGNFDQFSEVVDSHNHVHIAATGGGDLYYATDRTGTWTHKLLLSHGTKSTWGQPSIALDENDRVHIALERFPNAAGDKGVWYLSDVGRARDSFPATATKIAPAGNGEPLLKASGGHLFLVVVNGWCCVGDGTVQLLTNASGSWTTTIVGPGQDPSFRLGTDGSMQVAFDRGNTQRGIYYGRAASATGTFSTARIPGTSSHDTFPALAIDSANRPWIAWGHFANSSMSFVVAHRTGGTWTSPDPAVSGISGENSMAFDLDTLDRPNLAYGFATIHAVLQSNGSWHSTLITSNGQLGWLVLRRALNGGAVIAWTSQTGIFVSRR